MVAFASTLSSETRAKPKQQVSGFAPFSPHRPTSAFSSWPWWEGSCLWRLFSVIHQAAWDVRWRLTSLDFDPWPGVNRRVARVNLLLKQLDETNV